MTELSNDTNKNEPLDLETVFTVCDGKYTVHHKNGEVRVDRYDTKDWRIPVGDGFILALIQEIERLREAISNLQQINRELTEKNMGLQDGLRSYRRRMMQCVEALEDQAPSIPRCGSCEHWDYAEKGIDSLGNKYCPKIMAWTHEDGFCHNHPDWKEKG